MDCRLLGIISGGSIADLTTRPRRLADVQCAAQVSLRIQRRLFVDGRPFVWMDSNGLSGSAALRELPTH